MEGAESICDLTGEDCDILVLRGEDGAVTSESDKILRRHEVGHYPKWRDGDVMDIVRAVDQTYSRILDSKGFIFV